MAITPEYQEYLDSPKWKAKRRKILQRANYRCEECNKAQATQVHHKTYERIFNERLSDLLAVCAKCHMKIHNIKEKPKRKRVRFFRQVKRIYQRAIR